MRFDRTGYETRCTQEETRVTRGFPRWCEYRIRAFSRRSTSALAKTAAIITGMETAASRVKVAGRKQGTRLLAERDHPGRTAVG